MKYLIKIEELIMGLAGFAAWVHFGFSFPLLLILLLVPDLGMLGYLVSPKIGAIIYNIAHHKAVGLVVGAIGLYFSEPVLLMAGIIIWTHSSLDRALGYGLKYSDSFQHTHLGYIGKANETRKG